MNWQEIAGSVVNALRNAGVKKDIIDLQEKHVAMLTDEIAVLAHKLQVSETEKANLQQKMADLQQQLERLRPSGQRFNKVQDAFLEILFEESECPLSYIASKLRMQYEMVGHHKDVLVEHEAIRWTGGATGDFGEGEHTYELTPKGRAYIVNYLCS